MKCYIFTAVLALLFLVKPPKPNYQLNCDDIRITHTNFHHLQPLGRVHFMPRPPILLTLSPYIFVQNGYAISEAEVAHEAIHIVQQERDGWLFYPKYLGWYAYHYIYFIVTRWKQRELLSEASWYAYFHIPYEKEATRAELSDIRFGVDMLKKLQTNR